MMPKAATNPAPRVRHDALTDAPAPEIAERDQVEVRDQANDQTPQLRSPQEFYAELTKRADMRAFLKRLADR